MPRALWDASTRGKSLLAPVTQRPIEGGFLNIPRAFKRLFPAGEHSQPIECVLQAKLNPEVLQFSAQYCRISGGLTDWYRTVNAQAGDKVRIEALTPKRKYRLSLVKRGQEYLRTLELFESLGLHPSIAESAHSLFKDGHYSEAIRQAYVAMNAFVKQKANRPQLDGTNLMEAAFATTSPLLNINRGATQSERDERLGFQHIAKGSILGIRNPLSHDNIQLVDPYVTLEYLGLASLICKVAERARRARQPRRQRGT